MRKPKLIIIGLDGGTFKIIDPLIEQGRLPNFQRLIREGVRAILKSTIPPSTAPAWVSLMTGVNPGKHGLFDFRKLDKIIYDMHFNQKSEEMFNLIRSRYYAGKTIWDIFSKAGLKVSVIMMPMTYPAWKVNGYMLSGFPAPDFKTPSGYPLEWVSKIGPLFDMSTIKVNNEDRLISECFKLIKKIESILIEQLKKDECDVYSIVFSSTDFLQHHLWKYLSRDNSKYTNTIQEMYIEIDRCLGRILDLANYNECNFVILSDHGFICSPKKYFYTNAWLINEGYLVLKDQNLIDNNIFDLIISSLRYKKFGLRLQLKSYFKYIPKNVQKKMLDKFYSIDRFDWSRTKAFRLRIDTVEGIIINLKNRQSFGIVEEKEYESIRSEIIDKLKEIRDRETGDKIISNVYKREEIYNGGFVDLVPDIICVFNSMYIGWLGIDKTNMVEYIPKETTEAYSGIHDMDGILILNGPKFKKNLQISPIGIMDIFPTILHTLEIPIPSYADGKVIRHAFKDEFGSLPINYKEDAFLEASVAPKTSVNEEEAIKKALNGLGYLT